MKALATLTATQRYETARELQRDLEHVSRAERIAVSNLGPRRVDADALRRAPRRAARGAPGKGKQLADVLVGDEPTPSRRLARRRAPHRRFALELSAARAAVEGPVLRPRGRVALLVALERGRLGRVPRASSAGLGGSSDRAAINGGSPSSIAAALRPEARRHLDQRRDRRRTARRLRPARAADGPERAGRVRLTAEGYAPYTEEVALPTAGATGRVTARLERARAEAVAVLEVSTSPPGATVLVDGRASRARRR
jgi:hypothetical protein